MRPPVHPPRLAARIARLCLPEFDAERLLGALDDEYRSYQVNRRGRMGADLWYWRQVLLSLPPLLRSGYRGGARSIGMDVRQLVRRLGRAPVSAGATILTLSLTLGAGTAVLAVVDGVLLRPPPFHEPDALVTLGLVPQDDPAAAPRTVPYGTLRLWRERAESRAVLEAYDPTNLTLTGLGAAERVSALDVTPGFLAMLGASPTLGRSFGPDDAGGSSAAIVTHAFWQRRLGGEPDVVGRVIQLGGESHTVVGVLAPDFTFELNPSDVWRLFPATSADTEMEDAPVRVMGRLRGNTTAAGLATLLDDATRATSPNTIVRARPLAVALVGGTRRTLALLAAAAGFAIVVAFINLTVLLMVRSIDRRPELAVRRALGAPPSEATKQLVVEAIALVGAGIVGGVLLATAATPVAGRFALEFSGLASREIGVGWRSITVVSAAALVLAVAAGLTPAASIARRRVSETLRRGVTSSAGEVAFRRTLVAGEVALAFVLLTAMSLLTMSLTSLVRTDPGFEATGLLKLQLSLPPANYPSRTMAADFYSQLQDALEARLGSGRVAVVDEVPLSGDGGRRLVGGSPEALDSEAVVRTASPGYFDVLGVPVSTGRAFARNDTDQVSPRVVVTRSLLDQLPDLRQPVGHALWIAGFNEPAQIIGVVGEVKHRALDEPALPTVYLSSLQFPSASSVLVVRSDGPDGSVVSVVREEVARLDPDLPVYSIRSMLEVVAVSPGVPASRLLTMALTALALLSLVLSAVGLFGVAAHDVARRRPELALRMALGAEPGCILRTTLRTGVYAIATGVAVGAVLSMLTTRILGHMLTDTNPIHVLAAVAGTVALLSLVGVSAVLPSAITAARSDPMTALRSD